MGIEGGMNAVEPKPGPLKCPDPLTHSKLKGPAYARFPDVERQITEVIQHPPDTWENLIFANVSRWKSQTLVYLIRRVTSDTRFFGRLVDVIMRRASNKLGYLSQQFDRATVEIIDAEVAEALAELIFLEVPTKASEYLEIAFDDKVKQLAARSSQRYKHHPARYSVLTESNTKNGVAPLDTVATANDPYSLLADRIDQGLVRRLLKAITDPRHRQAFILRKMREWPMWNADPGVPSVLHYFGLVESQRRTVQYWIERAEEEMREAYGEEQ
jgi:hypothetical protein